MLSREKLRLSALATLAVTLVAQQARAAPEAHILRIDARAGIRRGEPVLTTVVDVAQSNRLSEVLQPCAASAAGRKLACWSTELERPGSLFTPFPFPDATHSLFLVKADGQEQLAKL